MNIPSNSYLCEPTLWIAIFLVGAFFIFLLIRFSLIIRDISDTSIQNHMQIRSSVNHNQSLLLDIKSHLLQIETAMRESFSETISRTQFGIEHLEKKQAEDSIAADRRIIAVETAIQYVQPQITRGKRRGRPPSIRS